MLREGDEISLYGGDYLVIKRVNNKIKIKQIIDNADRGKDVQIK